MCGGHLMDRPEAGTDNAQICIIAGLRIFFIFINRGFGELLFYVLRFKQYEASVV